nr:39S ribosomal protein L33, mitochondrial isoform X1 [Loxodonta africana]
MLGRFWSGRVGCLPPALRRDLSVESMHLRTGEDFRICSLPVYCSEDKETVPEEGSGGSLLAPSQCSVPHQADFLLPRASQMNKKVLFVELKKIRSL